MDCDRIASTVLVFDFIEARNLITEVCVNIFFILYEVINVGDFTLGCKFITAKNISITFIV